MQAFSTTFLDALPQQITVEVRGRKLPDAWLLA